MAKKMLMAATVPSMIGAFNIENIRLLLGMKYEIHVACNFTDTSVWSEEKTKELIEELRELGVKCHQVDFSREPKDVKNLIRSFCQMDKLIRKEKFSFVHCHAPTAGVICRLACHKNHIKVIYTAHGFHFYAGAPGKSWLMYYPIEREMSRITDVLLTINREDYCRARKYFYAKKTVYIPGVGVDVEKFTDIATNREKKRLELGISRNEKMLLSVGELNENKNHKVVIEALGRIKKLDSDAASYLHYCIAGKGVLQEELIKLADKLGVNLHLLGFRDDVPELLGAADIFLLPSIREGLNVSLMEAMAGGLPCLVSNIRGNRDLVEEAKGGFRVSSTDPAEWAHKIEWMAGNRLDGFSAYNRRKIRKFSIESVKEKMEAVYGEIRDEQGAKRIREHG